MIEQPLLTIIIPSYNHEQYIKECLNQVIKIDIQKRIIIIDDGSTDKTAEVIKTFINNYQNENIQFIEKENSGLISSLNIGLELCNTKYIYFIASDDIPNPDGIQQALSFLEQNENIDFFIGGGENFFENGEKTKVYTKKHDEFFSANFEKRYEKIFLDYPSPLLLQSTVFRTQILKDVGGWDRDLIWDDYPMFVKLLTNKNINFVFEPSIETVFYRHHGVNTYKNIEKQFMMVKQALEKLAPNDLKNRAIGNSLGYYLLKSLLNSDFKLASKLFLNANFSIKILAFKNTFIRIYKKILGLK
ncbi:glycosyltransferase family 2 protein [Aliarcobacter butzleri]